jgi:stress response protein YsnF
MAWPREDVMSREAVSHETVSQETLSREVVVANSQGLLEEADSHGVAS